MKVPSTQTVMNSEKATYSYIHSEPCKDQRFQVKGFSEKYIPDTMVMLAFFFSGMEDSEKNKTISHGELRGNA